MRFQDLVRRVRRLPAAAWIVAALPVVWFAQGSTFVALKVGVANVPPFLFSGTRFLIVGVLLLAWSVWRAGGRLQFDRRELLLAAATGAGLFLAGQGSASWSSQFLDPGVVAVLNSTMPLWAAVIGWLAFRTRIGILGSFGLLAGFAGVAFLAWPGLEPASPSGPRFSSLRARPAGQRRWWSSAGLASGVVPFPSPRCRRSLAADCRSLSAW
ncbi:MAG: DMT family transporter [Candidatus Dormibacteraeota bacterium]|nr:DMT family transporter [Candidatus Dormibacteraeota bacterium]